jgi:hypothetical protein
MSSDLLRRAAAKLREHANATNFGADGWAVDLKDSEVTTSDGGMMIADTMELAGTRPDASYIALMHPPVALAMAELLDHVADDISDAGDRIEPDGFVRNEYGTTRFDWTAAVKLARTVLREPEVTS